MATKIHPGVGDEIPAFSAEDYEGVEINSDDLLGSPFVLYFYPKDDTPGCTAEACSFRDAMESFENLDTLVIGVSPDNASSHIKFIEKHELNFTLLTDESLALAKKFGAVQEKTVDGKTQSAVIRSTFVVDSSGIIRWIESPVVIEGHAERVLKAVDKIAN